MNMTNNVYYRRKKICYSENHYPTIKVDKITQNVHVLVWEEKHGKSPKGFEIHHKDFDKSNYNLSNLELMTLSNHRRIHAGWIRIKEVWVARPCRSCKEILPLDFHIREMP